MMLHEPNCVVRTYSLIPTNKSSLSSRLKLKIFIDIFFNFSLCLSCLFDDNFSSLFVNPFFAEKSDRFIKSVVCIDVPALKIRGPGFFPQILGKGSKMYERFHGEMPVFEFYCILNSQKFFRWVFFYPLPHS